MRKKLSILALILFTIIVASEVQARCGQGYGRGAMWMGTQNYFPGVDLSEEQNKNFNSLRTAFITDTAAINTKLSQKDLELQTILLMTQPDTKQAAALQKELSDLQAEYDAKTLSYQLKARNLLTPDQTSLLPAGCSFGFGNMLYGQRRGHGHGYGRNGLGSGFGRGRGHGRGCW
ncbi:MAG: periplasmic heavy metal sensor [Deltaproteobacteria bacterium]|nr:periplasmic heavy metal sensor [Deltaproteobacteria bacterium]